MNVQGTCPYCGELYSIDDDRESIYCSGCGHIIRIKEFVEVTCPKCQHKVMIRAGKSVAYCQDCGAKMIFDDEESGELTEKERTILKMTDRALDRRHEKQLEKIRQKNELKRKKFEAELKQNNKEVPFKEKVLDVFWLAIIFAFFIAMLYVINH